jgi:hypothetical protein
VDLGDPVSYLVLSDGTDVISADGQKVGTVEHVLADANVDVFDGVIVDMREGPGGHRFADAEQVASIHERVVLTVDAEAAERLQKPGANPGHHGRRSRRHGAGRPGRQAQTRPGLPLRQLLSLSRGARPK